MEPTSDKNAVARLFLRLLFCYLLTLPLSLFCGASLPVTLTVAGEAQGAFVLLALLAGFSTLTKPALILFTAIKAFLDLALLRAVLREATSGFLSILPFNACLLFLFASLIFYLAAAARAEYFTFRTPARDGKLLREPAFWRYLLSALAFFAAATVLALLWRWLYSLLF